MRKIRLMQHIDRIGFASFTCTYVGLVLCNLVICVNVCDHQHKMRELNIQRAPSHGSHMPPFRGHDHLLACPSPNPGKHVSVARSKVISRMLYR